VFLSPAHPRVREWIADNIKELVTRYPVDGVHLDYIRQPVVSIGNDPTNTFQQFMIAYGGKNIVTKEGRFNGRDPHIHEAVVKAVDRLSTLYMEGYIPPSSVNWNDADDNNAFHAKLCVMDYDGTLSTELAMLRKQKAEYNDVLTIPPLLHNDGSQMATQYGVNCAIIPKGAANIEVAKDFLLHP